MKFPAFEPIDLKNTVEAFEIIELPLNHIIPDENQPRKNFDIVALNELAASIKQHGVIQPILVRKIQDDIYQIIAGERRWRASKLAGMQLIRAIIQNNDGQQDIAISLIENIQREELSPIELAESFYRLHKEFHLSHEAIAAMVGKSRPTVTNILRLLELPESIRRSLMKGEIEMGHARALLTSPIEQQLELAQKIIVDKLTVRDTENLVQLQKSSSEKKVRGQYSEETDIWAKKLSKNSRLRKVDLKINKRGQGRVVIHFDSRDEIDWIVEQLTAAEQVE